MKRNVNQFPRRYQTAAMLSLVLPTCCPHCSSIIVWGWTEDQLDEPYSDCGVHIRRIPRPDQTVFCPNCEAQILN